MAHENRNGRGQVRITAEQLTHKAFPCLIAVLLSAVMMLGEAAVLQSRLKLEQIAQAKEFQQALWPFKKWSDTKTKAPPTMPFYSTIDFAKDTRFDAIGALLIAKAVKVQPSPQLPKGGWDLAEGQSGICTAFHISDNTLATAAHCLRDAGVTLGSGHFMLFRQQYNPHTQEPYNKDLATKFERVIVEWAYPAEYNNAGECWCYESGYDYAFLKIEGKISPGTAPYTLATPAETTAYLNQHADVIIAGYPSDRATKTEAATVECKLHKTSEDEFTKDAGVLRQQQKSPKDPHLLAQNQMACIGQHGTMGPRGSGGPWLLKTVDAGKQRLVIGITAWGMVPPRKSTGEYDPDYATAEKFSRICLSAITNEHSYNLAVSVMIIQGNPLPTMTMAIKRKCKNEQMTDQKRAKPCN